MRIHLIALKWSTVLKVQPSRCSWGEAQVYHSCVRLSSTSAQICPMVIFTIFGPYPPSKCHWLEGGQTHWRSWGPTSGIWYPTLPLSPVASAHSCLSLPVAWDSTTIQTFFEAGALLIHLLIHLAWRPAHRNYSVSIYWLASFQFTSLHGFDSMPQHPSACLGIGVVPGSLAPITQLCRSCFLT